MKKYNIYLLVGIAWMACCFYQLKNHNMFMAAVSAIIAILFFFPAIYHKLHQ